jgi:aspartyl-tRNA(Asn)/glutamyl-tRNA(Gln) amidotransferase subunit A
VLSGVDERDHLSLPPSSLDWLELAVDVRGLRIGLHLDPGVGLPVSSDILAAVTEAARAFEAAGAIVEPVNPFLRREMLDGLDTFWRVRAWSDMSALPEERRAKVLPYIADWAAGGADVSGVDAYRGFAQIDAIAVAALRATERFDVVLSPTCPVSAPLADWPSPTNDPSLPFEHIAFTVPYNMSGQPAVSINCGYTRDDQPIGLQISGRRFADLDVLRAAAAFETLRPLQLPWP